MSESLAEGHEGHAVDVRRVARRTVLTVPAAAWVAVLIAALATRPLLPVDETRYATVAWEMLRSGDWLVPHLNGRPYSDKPPLLFWLITSGWSVLGPVELWARLVGPLSAAASLALTAVLARRLWPGQTRVALAAPLVLAGTVAWSVYGTVLLFDALLTACVLAGLIGLVESRRGHRRGYALFALGLGLGVLAKGPVILIHLLPAAVTAWWWDAPRPVVTDAATARFPAAPGFRPAGGAVPHLWGVALGVAGIAGVLIALAWAVPAALSGGDAYGRAIFLGQTTGRVVKSFAHRRPFWWYIPQVLWMTLPWWAWPTLWRGVREWRRRTSPLAADAGLRFCAIWAVAALVAFTLVSGKQVHYLLPELAAFALIVARLALATDSSAEGRSSRPARVGWPVMARLSMLATGTLIVVVAAHILAAHTLAARYDLGEVASHLASVERSGAPIAHEGRYAGQFTYLGRLERPIAEISADSIDSWLRLHPTGRAVSYAKAPADTGVGGVELVRRYRGQYIIVRRAPP